MSHMTHRRPGNYNVSTGHYKERWNLFPTGDPQPRDTNQHWKGNPSNYDPVDLKYKWRDGRDENIRRVATDRRSHSMPPSSETRGTRSRSPDSHAHLNVCASCGGSGFESSNPHRSSHGNPDDELRRRMKDLEVTSIAQPCPHALSRVVVCATSPCCRSHACPGTAAQPWPVMLSL